MFFFCFDFVAAIGASRSLLTDMQARIVEPAERRLKSCFLTAKTLTKFFQVQNLRYKRAPLNFLRNRNTLFVDLLVKRAEEFDYPPRLHSD